MLPKREVKPGSKTPLRDVTTVNVREKTYEVKQTPFNHMASKFQGRPAYSGQRAMLKRHFERCGRADGGEGGANGSNFDAV